MHSREQQYATTIYGQVKEYPGSLDENSKERKQYGSMAHKLPILVRSAGLAQALAFVDSRQGSQRQPYQRLLEHLALTTGFPNAERILKQSREANLSDYLYMTEQVMLALKWYKRFAESVLHVLPGEDDEGVPNEQ
jgi:CRISPR-associated protein Cmr5